MRKYLALIAAILFSSSTAAHATLLFHVRADNTANLAARVSQAGATPGCGGNQPTAGVCTSTVDASAIGGFKIALAANNYLLYRGFENITNGSQALSFHVRIKPAYSGTPSSNQGIFWIGGHSNASSEVYGTLSLQHNASTGNLVLQQADDSGVVGINAVSLLNAWSPVAGTWYDFLVSATGTTAAGGYILWIDDVNKGSTTSTKAWSNPRPINLLPTIQIGGAVSVNASNYDYGEIASWNTVIDPTTVALVSGTGLTGASRTQFISSTAFDATSYTDPGAANVLSTVGSYLFAGLTQTPTWVAPTTGQVEHGVAFGAASALTGTYRAYDLWDSVMASQLQSGVTKNQDGVSVSGILSIPTAAQNAAATWEELKSAHTTAGTYGVNLDTTVSSRATQTSVNSIPTNPLLTTDSRLNNLDATVSSRLATSGYTAPDNTTIGLINTHLGVPSSGTIASELESIVGPTGCATAPQLSAVSSTLQGLIITK